MAGFNPVETVLMTQSGFLTPYMIILRMSHGIIITPNDISTHDLEKGNPKKNIQIPASVIVSSQANALSLFIPIF
ncbi:MAG: hypothetical protein HQL30_06940 [Candidatus Omnitrophica bacterium]|nr:hypothetical protein [Candidatus Omnitrophota bacterium]